MFLFSVCVCVCKSCDLTRVKEAERGATACPSTTDPAPASATPRLWVSPGSSARLAPPLPSTTRAWLAFT